MAVTLFDQLVVTVNGLACGAGQAVRVQEIRGLDESPGVRTTDTPRPGGDGDYSGTDYREARVIELDLIATPAPADAWTLLAQLRRAFQLGPAEVLVSGLPGLPTLRFMGKIRRSRIPTDRNSMFGALLPQLHIYVADPRRMAAAVTVLVLDMTPPPGPAPVYLTPPFTPPILPQGRPGMLGQLYARNNGNMATDPVIRVWGPSPSFSLVEASSGRVWGYSAAVADGDYLLVDMRAHAVLLNGTASRREYKWGAWFSLPPGDVSVTYLPDTSAPTAVVEVRFRDAY